MVVRRDDTALGPVFVSAVSMSVRVDDGIEALGSIDPCRIRSITVHDEPGSE